LFQTNLQQNTSISTIYSCDILRILQARFQTRIFHLETILIAAITMQFLFDEKHDVMLKNIKYHRKSQLLFAFIITLTDDAFDSRHAITRAIHPTNE